MWEMLEYPFFRNAIAGVLIISVAAAVIGTYIVARRLVAISGGVTHACFGGLGLGYYLGFNPIFGAAVAAIAASAGVEWMARSHKVREDSAIAVIWALGMAIGIFFVFLTPDYVPELNTFLFGNVITITSADLMMFAVYTAVLLAFIVTFRRQVLAVAFDRDFAAVMHIPVRFISYSMTVLVAVCIVLTIRLVGVMLLMSMLAMPQIIAELFSRRFYGMMLWSVVISAVCCLTGLALCTTIDVPCSALIVMVMVTAYIVVRLSVWLRRRLRPASLSVMIIALLATSLSSCSLKKNTAASRNYMAFITRYNIHYNGDEHFKETLKSMEDGYEDDFSQLLYMHPAEAYNNEKAPQPSGDFTRSIEKAQKAIQIRSIKKRPARKAGKANDPEYKKWLKREEYNPFLHNSWMMMARSQYYGGDFLGAAATFYYIARHFWWLPATVTEAKLWQARSYIAIDWLFEAESILNSIKPKEIADNSTLQGLYYFDRADLLVKQKDYDKAISELTEAIKYAKGSQKVRMIFLLGQVYVRAGQPDRAYECFKKAGNSSGVNYRTKFNARIKQSEVYQGADINKEVKSLRAMTRFGANKDYLDQIYYAIGNLYMSRGDTTEAIKNYALAAEKSTRNGIDKALAQLSLGRIYFDRHQYEKAQPCYAEAVPQLPDNFPDYKQIRKRSDVLDELTVYSENVTLQDSLLRLAAMTPEQQREVVDRIIAELKKREKEEAGAAAREEYLAQQAAAGTGLQQGSTQAPSTFQLNTDKSWYFYNQATRNAGRTDFQKRWGSRKLEDDWRRRNKASYSVFEDVAENDESLESDSVDSETDAAAAEALEHANDPHYPEYYLRQIPSTDADKLTANDVIQEGLYNMGLILKDNLEDFKAAEGEWDRLMSRYPDNIYRLDVYYNTYLMMMRQNDLAGAEHYRQLILSEFPDSKYGEALADPQYMEKLKRMPEVEQGLYDRAYRAYMADNNAEVHEIYAEMRRDYPMSRIMPKFMFIDALSYVTENNPEKFEEVLRELIERYPDTDVSPLASSYIKLLGEGRKLNSTSSNVRGMLWSTRLSNDSTAVNYEEPADFDFESDGPQLMVLIYSIDAVNANQLLFDVARFNFSSFVVKDFDLEQMKFGRLGLLVISGFDSQQQVLQYRSVVERPEGLKLPEGVIPLIISKNNFDILTEQGRTLDEYLIAAGDKRLEQIHRALQPDTDTPPVPAEAPEMPQPAESDKSDRSDESLPATPEPSKPQQSAAPAQSQSQPQPQPEEFDYDIPVPVVPVGKPPIAPRTDLPYPTGSEGDDPLLD